MRCACLAGLTRRAAARLAAPALAGRASCSCDKAAGPSGAHLTPVGLVWSVGRASHGRAWRPFRRASTQREPCAVASTGNVPTVPHVPVLLHEVASFYKEKAVHTFVDATLGAGGHASAIVEQHPELATVIGIDLDPAAHRVAKARLEATMAHYARSPRLVMIESNFSRLKTVLEQSIPGAGVDGILLDLGMSSMQVDSAERGFSFMREGPLDMRMGPTVARSAEEVVNTWPEAALERIFREYGEDRSPRRAARRIIEARLEAPILTTQQLVAAVGRPARGGRSHIHPATRIFQALRIAVNDELASLEAVVPDAVAALAPGGRLSVISFHSLEDRVVKWAFLRAAGRAPLEAVDSGELWDAQPLPPCPASVKILTRKPIGAGKDECSANPRARSAKLRVVEKL